jgi:hypothetical protein
VFETDSPLCDLWLFVVEASRRLEDRDLADHLARWHLDALKIETLRDDDMDCCRQRYLDTLKIDT